MEWRLSLYRAHSGALVSDESGGSPRALVARGYQILRRVPGIDEFHVYAIDHRRVRHGWWIGRRRDLQYPHVIARQLRYKLRELGVRYREVEHSRYWTTHTGAVQELRARELHSRVGRRSR